MSSIYRKPKKIALGIGVLALGIPIWSTEPQYVPKLQAGDEWRLVVSYLAPLPLKGVASQRDSTRDTIQNNYAMNVLKDTIMAEDSCLSVSLFDMNSKWRSYKTSRCDNVYFNKDSFSIRGIRHYYCESGSTIVLREYPRGPVDAFEVLRPLPLDFPAFPIDSHAGNGMNMELPSQQSRMVRTSEGKPFLRVEISSVDYSKPDTKRITTLVWDPKYPWWVLAKVVRGGDWYATARLVSFNGKEVRISDSAHEILE